MALSGGETQAYGRRGADKHGKPLWAWEVRRVSNPCLTTLMQRWELPLASSLQHAPLRSLRGLAPPSGQMAWVLSHFSPRGFTVLFSISLGNYLYHELFKGVSDVPLRIDFTILTSLTFNCYCSLPCIFFLQTNEPSGISSGNVTSKNNIKRLLN